MERGRGAAFGTSDLPVPFIQASPDELSPRSLRSSLRSNRWLGALGSQTPPPPSSSKSAMAKQSRFMKRHKRSLSDPDLKDIKKNVDSQLSAFITLVANLEVKKEIMERSRQKEANVEAAAAAAAAGSSASNFSSSGSTRTASCNVGGGGGSILLKLKGIAEAFVNTPPDALHSREIVRQIQKLHLNAAKSATSLERELMIKLLFIISTCSRLEEYKVPHTTISSSSLSIPFSLSRSLARSRALSHTPSPDHDVGMSGGRRRDGTAQRREPQHEL
jgi:hypothetical protein